MNNPDFESSPLSEPLNIVSQCLREAEVDQSALARITDQLNRFGELALESEREELVEGAEWLARVSDLAAGCCGDQDQDGQQFDEMIQFVEEQVGVLSQAVHDESRLDDILSFVEFAQENWRDYLSLFESDDFQEADWQGDDAEELEDLDGPSEALSGDQIKLMLSALANDNAPEDEAAEAESDESAAFQETPEDRDDVSARADLAQDRELLEAYLDDALRCLGSMEQAAMKIEKDPSDRATGRQFCRELHTLKGASATVGLSGLASHLHELESSLEGMFKDPDQPLNADSLFEAVDRVRQVIGSLNKDASTAEPEPAEARAENGSDNTPAVTVPLMTPASRRVTEYSGLGGNDDASIRIRAAKLDRLMDMLAELVVLRNRRESHVAEFNELNEELSRCAARVSFAEEGWRRGRAEFGTPEGLHHSSAAMSEVSKDIAVVSQGLRELQKPVVDDNAAISRFIRDFRQELMQLRRVPVSGLFKRLQRAARDAAKSEQKQIEVQVSGEHAGLEQEIQERLFESLLHIVRNSVSHGIEAPDVRARAGKEPAGTIELEASSNAQLLMIEVRDDGSGINYDAVRRRGIEQGLLHATDRPTHSQLAKLIFQPGFSTREQASEISGRGVGMDVVGNTIEQLHGRIEIESIPGQGTTMRLLIPLRTGIEHVMVFRAGGQSFALPMQSVTAAKAGKPSQKQTNRVSLAQALSLSSTNDDTVTSQDVLLLRRSGPARRAADKTGDQLAIAVDELIGPEEVVVRKLPNLLRNHPLFNGITLSGSGEKVLLLDADRVVDFCNNPDFADHSAPQESWDEKPNQRRALVVDDSLTARKVLAKFLKQQGLAVVEAGDGIEAIERLHRETFDLVFTDLDMPRMGGLELLTDIQTGDYCVAPRIVVSSRNEEAFRGQAIELGASDFLSKPVSETSINQLLEQFELLQESIKGS